MHFCENGVKDAFFHSAPVDKNPKRLCLFVLAVIADQADNQCYCC